MSAVQAPSAERLIAEARGVRIDFSVTTALVALVAYEYLLTIRAEWRILYRRPWTYATCLLVVTRYSMVAVTIMNALPWSGYRVSGLSACEADNIIYFVFSEIPIVVSAAFSALRTYAVCPRGRTLAIIVFVLNMVTPITDIWFYAQMYFAPRPPDTISGASCESDDRMSPVMDADNTVCIAAFVTFFVADLLVVSVIWANTWRSGSILLRPRVGSRVTLIGVLVRDGTIYFILLLVINIFVLVDNLNLSFEQTGIIQCFADTFRPLVIHRSLLNLRDASGQDESQITMHDISLSHLIVNTPQTEYIAGNRADTSLELGSPYS